MLRPLQTRGTKPPLFFVHGFRGITFSVGPRFAAELGADQPFYVINANGMDGRQPVIDDVREMVLAYLEEIEGACPMGPLRIGGMCNGCHVAIEIARTLQEKGRQTGPVILADPPVVPIGYEKRAKFIDPREPKIAERLYQEARNTLLEQARNPYDDLPFDPADPRQLHAATLAGVGSIVAFSRHVPSPFSGPVEAIISAEHAPGFFHPLMPWQKLLCGPRIVHVLPWRHHEMFRGGRKIVARFMRSALEEVAASENSVEQPMQSAAI